MRLARLTFTIFVIGTVVPVAVFGQTSQLVAVPDSLPESVRTDLLAKRTDLESRYSEHAKLVAEHRSRCSNIPKSSPIVADCKASQSAINANAALIRADATSFGSAISKASTNQIKVLESRVANDVEAIRRLGFARRTEDFAMWEELAAKAKSDFEGEVLDTITGIAIDKVRGKAIDAFKGFDEAKAASLINAIRKRGYGPSADSLIAALERVGKASDKVRVADDAEFIVKQIEDLRSGTAASETPVESAKFVGGLLEGLIDDPRLKLLITEVKLTTSALYNNATRRVARNEVERLTELTELQLKDLERLRLIMERHVKEIKGLKAALAEQKNEY